MIENRLRPRPPSSQFGFHRAYLLPAFVLVALSSVALGVGGRGLLARGPAAATVRLNAEPPAIEEGFVPAASGPWGKLLRADFYLRPPGSAFRESRRGQAHWRFPNQAPQQIEALFVRAGLDVSLRNALIANADCDGRGCDIVLPPDLVVRVGTGARAVIYPELAKNHANMMQASPYRWCATDDVQLRCNVPGLSDLAFGHLRSLTWRQGNMTLLSDAETLFAMLPSEERTGAARALNSLPTVRLRLSVGPTSDLDSLVSYWSAGRDLRPLLDSIAHSPGGRGGEISVVELLPPFARLRANTFPEGGDGQDGKALQNCFWTALNFWNTTPDDSLSDQARVREVLQADYVELNHQDLRLGDLMVVEDSSGILQHAAVHVASNVWFTRNGFVKFRPFVLMDYSQLVARYPDGSVRFYRRQPS